MAEWQAGHARAKPVRILSLELSIKDRQHVDRFSGSSVNRSIHPGIQLPRKRSNVRLIVMTVVQRQSFAPFAADQIYALVNDIESYPDFLPWCVAADVLERAGEAMKARLTVKRGRFDYAFTTANHLVPGREIQLKLIDGPFKRLDGLWRFEPADGGCLVKLDLRFEFTSRLLSLALTAAFKPIADSMVEAFKQRAYAVYAN